MKVTIEHRIGIQAPPEAIWAVVSDIARWRDWNPLYPRADGAALRIPVERLRPDRAQHAATKQADDVELVRALPQGDTAAAGNIEFVRPARTVDPVAETPGVDHPHAAEPGHALAEPGGNPSAMQRQICPARAPRHQ